ncbi:MAG: hypothetical protein E6Q27_01845 [Aeromicrobium sp.]|nr:MAG: hypothetical protein E6Q27_01845 [Aeromicrobium sp.]
MTRRIVLVAGVLWVFLDIVRMWTPSLITIFGRAAETPAELIGAFALACGGVPLLLLWLTRSAASIEFGALLVVLSVRVALAMTDGGPAQLWLASIGVVAGIAWLSLVLGRESRIVAPSFAIGLALAVGTHAALGTFGAVWRRDAWGTIELVASVGLVTFAWFWMRRGTEPASIAPTKQQAFFVFPALLFAGVYVANAGRASTASESWGLLALALGLAIGVGVLAVPASYGSIWLARLGLLGALIVLALIEVERGGISGQLPAVAVVAYVVGVSSLIYLLAVGAARTDRTEARETSRSLLVATGAIVWVVLLFVYYAGYDLGYRADIVLVAASIAFWQWRAARPVSHYKFSRRSAIAFGSAAIAMLLAAAFGPALTLRPVAATEPDDTARIVAYNVRMGYGMSGRFEATAVAELLARENADVILLSEVDRGWLLNGGQDQLRILASMLGMHSAFAPAADPVWGDAILSRAPITNASNYPFESFGAVTGAQALVGSTQINGKPITVISTHLQNGPKGTNDTYGQAQALASIMRQQAGLVVMGGDLNTLPTGKAWNALIGAGFTDAFASNRPAYTWSADDPTEEIDHLFVSPTATSANPRVVESLASDHLPVFVDIELK